MTIPFTRLSLDFFLRPRFFSSDVEPHRRNTRDSCAERRQTFDPNHERERVTSRRQAGNKIFDINLEIYP